MRICVKKIENDQPIFGALMVDFVSFIRIIPQPIKDLLVFQSKNHGQVYCDVLMAQKIAERLKINKKDNSVILEGIMLVCDSFSKTKH